MGKKNTAVKISFKRGRMNDGSLVQTKVFTISSKKEKRIKPDHIKPNKRSNQTREIYTLLAGKKYRIETLRTKKGKTYRSSAILVVEKTGKIRIEDWKGDCPPNFSIL